MSVSRTEAGGRPRAPVPGPDRRQLLLGAGAVATGSLLAPAARAARTFGPPRTLVPKTRHLVLVVFGGGVRTRETFGLDSNVPGLEALAKEGVLYTRVRTANLGHFGASLSIFTGVAEPRGIRDNSPGLEPTLFEYLRKDLGLSAGDVWITTSGGAQQVNYASSLHPDYGREFAATTLDGDGIFNEEFKRLVTAYGLPGALPEGRARSLERMRAALDGSSRELESRARVESYILHELRRGTSEVSGSNAADIKALTLARNLLSVFRPRVLGVVLQDPDVAHRSFNGYVEVIRRNDAALGELVLAVKADPELAESTSIVVLPEFGRDRDLNTRRGLDHGDGSEDLNYVTCAAWGPDFARGRVIRDDVRSIDVVPTLCHLMGAAAPHARGRKLPGLV